MRRKRRYRCEEYQEDDTVYSRRTKKFYKVDIMGAEGVELRDKFGNKISLTWAEARALTLCKTRRR